MRVLLTRPQAETEELGARLTAHGVEWLGEPMLRIVPVPWHPDVLAGRPALLITSANASRELLRVAEARRDIPIFAVGPATASPLVEAGFTNVQAAGGTAAGLIDLARRGLNPTAGPLLYLSGFHISRDLASALTRDGFAVDRVIVYRADAVSALSARLRREMSEARIDAALFLSARTATTFRELMLASGLAEACSRMIAIAFSTNVAEALKPLHFRHVEIVASPNLESAVDAVLRA